MANRRGRYLCRHGSACMQCVRAHCKPCSSTAESRHSSQLQGSLISIEVRCYGMAVVCVRDPGKPYSAWQHCGTGTELASMAVGSYCPTIVATVLAHPAVVVHSYSTGERTVPPPSAFSRMLLLLEESARKDTCIAFHTHHRGEARLLALRQTQVHTLTRIQDAVACHAPQLQ